MSHETVLILFAAVVSIATTVQAVALVVALRAVKRLEARFGEAERELRALRPRLERLGHAMDLVADWTEGAAERVPRVAAELDNALDQIRGVARLGAILLMKPLRPLGAALALWKGLKSGADAYRRFRPARSLGPSTTPPPGGRE